MPQVGISKRVRGKGKRAVTADDRPLTPLQQRFVAEMLKDPRMNATDCIIRAGCQAKDRKVAGIRAAQMLADDRIANAISKEHERRMWNTDVTPERTIRELKAIAYFDPNDLYDERRVAKHPCDLPREVRGALESYDVSYTESESGDGEFTQVKHVRPRAYNKLQGLAMLMKHQGIDGTTKIQGQIDANISGGVSVQLDLGQLLLDLEKSRVVDADTYKIEEKEQADVEPQTEARDADSDSDGR